MLDKLATSYYIIPRNKMYNKVKQLKKGILELAILSCLNHESHYGYSLIKTLFNDSNILIGESTIYPILGRLTKDGLVNTEWMESEKGPPRKYYSLTKEGKRAVKLLNIEFDKLVELVKNANKKPLKMPFKEKKRVSIKKGGEDVK